MELEEEVIDEQGASEEPDQRLEKAVDTEAHLKDLTSRQRKYVRAVVHLKLAPKDAAVYAGLSEFSIYNLRNNARVCRAIDVETKVHFRSLRLKVVHKLEEILDDGENEVARVNAAKALNDMIKPKDEDVHRSVMQPGYVLVIPGLQQVAAPVIEHDDNLPPLPDRYRGHAEARAARWGHKRQLVPRIPRETRGPEQEDEEDQ